MRRRRPVCGFIYHVYIQSQMLISSMLPDIVNCTLTKNTFRREPIFDFTYPRFVHVDMINLVSCCLLGLMCILLILCIILAN